MKNIVLIGMPGAGKSTVGVILAKTLGFQFIDTDLLISAKTGEKLQDTINNKGLETFLKVEEDVCKNLNLEGFVIATGGSVVLSDKAMQNLKKMAKVVFIDVPLSEIKKRVSNITTRGIACEVGETLDDVYIKRFPLYNKFADIVIKSEKSTIENTVEQIIKQL